MATIDKSISAPHPLDPSQQLNLNESETRPSLSLIEIEMDQIVGIDTDTAQLLTNLDFIWPDQIDLTSWSTSCAILIYMMAPMCVISRKNGYDVLGSGRSWNLAKKLYRPSDKVPVLLLTGKKRVPVADKLQFLAAEIIGLTSEYRTRPNLPVNLKRIWDDLNAAHVKSIEGIDAKAFSRATGFSLKSLERRRYASACRPRVSGPQAKTSAAQS